MKALIKRTLRLARTENKRNLYWWPGPNDSPKQGIGNFGDLIGPYLYRAITGWEPIHRVPHDVALATVYLTVGSVMRLSRANAIVWGSGILRKDEIIRQPHSVAAVRGPMTRNRLLECDIPCPEIYGDPAILLSDYFQPVTDQPQEGIVGIVPHFVDFERAKTLFTENSELTVINVIGDVEKVVAEIAQCNFIMSSSLHGLIIAQTYGIPAVWVKFSDSLAGDNVKFFDFFQSTGIEHAPAPELINKSVDLPTIKAMVNDWPQPTPEKLKSIRLDLRASCPFHRRR